MDRPGTYDFLGVVFHEFGHILGVGTTDSWDNQVNAANAFQGSAASAEFGGDVPLAGANPGAHWNNATSNVVDGTESYLTGIGSPQSALYNPTFGFLQRKFPTDLDLAGLSDIGWEVSNPPAVVPLPAGGWLMLSGMALLFVRQRPRRSNPA